MLLINSLVGEILKQGGMRTSENQLPRTTWAINLVFFIYLSGEGVKIIRTKTYLVLAQKMFYMDYLIQLPAVTGDWI